MCRSLLLVASLIIGSCTKVLSIDEVDINIDNEILLINEHIGNLDISMRYDLLGTNKKKLESFFEVDEKYKMDLSQLFKNLELCFLGDYMFFKSSRSFQGKSGILLIEKVSDTLIKLWIIQTKDNNDRRMYVRQIVYGKYLATNEITMQANGCLYSDDDNDVLLYKTLQSYNGEIKKAKLPNKSMYSENFYINNHDIFVRYFFALFSFIISFLIGMSIMKKYNRTKLFSLYTRIMIQLIISLFIAMLYYYNIK